MVLWAIKDFNTGKYYDFRSHYVEDMNPHTEFFKTKLDATRKIEGLPVDGYEDFPSCGLDNELAWSYLERKYRVTRWALDVTKEELALAKALFRLSPVMIEIAEQ